MTKPIPQVFFNDDNKDDSFIYRLAYEWGDNGIVICIPKNGNGEPFATQIKIKELHKTRYYR